MANNGGTIGHFLGALRKHSSRVNSGFFPWLEGGRC